MRVSLQWLGDFVDLPPLDVLTTTLVQAGVEVEQVHNPAAHCHNVVVAQVIEVAAHPESNKLHVCKVSDGAATHSIVCGAPNVRPGMKAPLARVGANLRGVRIGRRTLRGVASDGMLCSAAELGLGDTAAASGLWELDVEAPLGEDVFVAAQVMPTLTLGITPNRADLLSHLGIAREMAAFTNKRAKPVKARATEKGPDAGSLARVLVEDNAACKRYVARVVRGLKVGPSPQWLRDRLESIGQRSINNVVDATNYVLWEMGHPLHAFDLTRLSVEAGLPTIRVRRAKAGEKLKTLDHVVRDLSEHDLVIADAHRPIALAGVMGGSDSEVGEHTSAVLLESAYFDPAVVRLGSKRHDLRTEAALRFGRGSDPTALVKAVDRCAQLLADVAGGEVAKGLLESTQKVDPAKEIPVRLAQVQRRLGLQLAAETVVQLLDPLEIRCVTRTEAALIFSPPGFRPDISQEVDLLEEIARRHGYSQVPDRLPDTSGPFVFTPRAPHPPSLVREALLGTGITEVVTYGFGSPRRYALFAANKPTVTLINPLGEEYSCMRTSLLPGVLQSVARNLSRGSRDVRLFEVGSTFHGSAFAAKKKNARDRDLPQEVARVCIVLTGDRQDGRWYGRGESVDFADLRGALEAVADRLGRPGVLALSPDGPSYLRRGAAAELHVAKQTVGWAGALAPALLQTYDIGASVWAAELSLPGLLAAPTRRVRHVPLPKFPKIRRDVAVIAPSEVTVAALRTFIAAHAAGNLGRDTVERVWLFDVFEGKSMGAGQRSLAFGIDYRAPSRTLTDAEVTPAFHAMIEALCATFPVKLRG